MVAQPVGSSSTTRTRGTLNVPRIGSVSRDTGESLAGSIWNEFGEYAHGSVHRGGAVVAEGAGGGGYGERGAARGSLRPSLTAASNGFDEKGFPKPQVAPRSRAIL